jgi:hypothetical protein
MRRPPDRPNGGPPEPPFTDLATAKQLVSAFTLPRDAGLADDPAAPDYSRGDLGPLRGPRRRRKPSAFGWSSTFGLVPEALRAERLRRMIEGWAEWEIEARLADPDAEQPQQECRGEFGPGGRWHEGCQECAA